MKPELVSLIVAACSVLVSAPDVHAASGKLTGKSGLTTIAVKAGKTITAPAGKFSMSLPSGSDAVRLYQQGSNGRLAGAVVAGIKKGSKYYNFTAAKKAKLCKKAGVLAVMGFKVSDKKGLNIGTIKKSGSVYYVAADLTKAQLATAATAQVDAGCAPLASGANLGLILPSGKSFSALGVSAKAGDANDKDGDGLINQLDVDADNDGVLNAYDTDTQLQTGQFRVFSNLKLDLAQSVNVNALKNGGITDDVQMRGLIDASMQSAETLAIQVVGDPASQVELDCGALNYCKSGGSGAVMGQGPQGNTPFPGNPGDAIDPDSDGKGTITRGNTGDFQLKTNALSSQIGAGDVLTEVVDEGAAGAYQVTSMLNFAFITTPGIKTLQLGAGAVQEVHYPATEQSAGGRQNCLVAPATGDVVVTIEAWRPQRFGISGAGEGTYVDIGNSNINIDLPNGPQLPGPGGGSQGAGLCVRGFSTSDPNLNLSTVPSPSGSQQRLKDLKSDEDASVSNTYTFTINLSECLSNPGGGRSPVAWNAGESLNVDLQMSNSSGDNAAQKFCVTRQGT